MTPILLILILIVFLGAAFFCFLFIFGDPYTRYASSPVLSGIVDGYQTMDILAALNFGIIIAINIQDLGIKKPKRVTIEIMKAGLIAGMLLAIVYCATGYVGMHSSGMFDQVDKWCTSFSLSIEIVLDQFAQILVGLIFFIACFNVCTDYYLVVSQYFQELVPKISYKKWLLLFVIFSFIIQV